MTFTISNRIDKVDLSPIYAFLGCETPAPWLKTALNQLDILLIDHAHCEKKAASSAINFMFRYPDRAELLDKMSRLAREELRHFEQVLVFLRKRGVPFRHLPPSGYAKHLQQKISTYEPMRLVDSLIVGAVIEARSCERFAKLAPQLPADLQKFYVGLLASEARHFQGYLQLAELYSPQPIAERVAEIVTHEAVYILGEDLCFRFHSGVVVAGCEMF